MTKLIALMVFFALLVVVPSPIKKVPPKANKIEIAAVSHVEAAQPLEKKSAPVAQPEPKSPDPAPVVQPQPVPEPVPQPVPEPVVQTAFDYVIPDIATKQSWAAQAGIAASDFEAVDYILSHESNWRWWVKNNEGSGATGVCQALPGDKMASAGADWATNPITQLKWCSTYATSRYGGWWGAYNHWVNSHWW